MVNGLSSAITATRHRHKSPDPRLLILKSHCKLSDFATRPTPATVPGRKPCLALTRPPRPDSSDKMACLALPQNSQGIDWLVADDQCHPVRIYHEQKWENVNFYLFGDKCFWSDFEHFGFPLNFLIFPRGYDNTDSINYALAVQKSGGETAAGENCEIEVLTHDNFLFEFTLW